MTNTTNKLTNKTAILTAMEYIPESETELRNKLTAMVVQLEKKNASPKKLTAAQDRNAELAETIAKFLKDHAGTGYTVSDMLKEIPELEGDSNQHVSAIMKPLVDSQRVEKYTEKRRSYFRIVVEG